MAENSEIIVAGLGVVGGFGCGREELLRALSQPTGPNSQVEVKTRQGKRYMPAFTADLKPLTELVGKRKLRRVDRFSRMTTLAAGLALHEARELELDQKRIGIVLATGYGANATTFDFLGSCLDYGDQAASPLLFSGSGHSGALSNATILLGLQGPLLTLCQAHLPITMGMLTALGWLREKRVDAVLVGGADEYIPLRGYLHESVCDKAEQAERGAETSRLPPLGEGAAFLLLTEAERGAVCSGKEKVAVRQLLLNEAHEMPGKLPPCAEIICGATSGCGGRRMTMPANIRQGCLDYSSVYGGLPTAMAFDLAIAAARLGLGNQGVASQKKRVFCLEPTVCGTSGMIELARCGE